MSDTPENIVVSPSLGELQLGNDGGGPPPNDPLRGMTLGDYVVEKAVAWGGMGIVYRALHPLIGRQVAVKVLRPSFASDPEQMSRFLKEARAVAAIKHRGIIDIIGFGRVPAPDGRQYMVMEFLEGEALEATMAREHPMSAARVLDIADELLDALSAAHRVGVIHRDLKPANVFMTRQSNGLRYVKLVDFGLARVADPEAVGRGSGRASMMAGTPEYVSPEQAKGLAATPRTDLYCLGVMLFEMLTGRLPFLGPSMLELLNAHVNETPARVSTLVEEIPPALDDLVAQLLLKVASQRPSSADVARQKVQRMIRELKQNATGIVRMPPAFRPPKPEEERTVLNRPPTTDKELMFAPTAQPLERAPVPSPTRVVPIQRRRSWGRVLGATAIIGVAAAALLLWPQAPVAPSPPEPPVTPAPTAVQPDLPAEVIPPVAPAPVPVPVPRPPAPAPVKNKPAPRPMVARPLVRPPLERGTVTLVVTLNGERTGAFIDVDGVRWSEEAPTTLTLDTRPYTFRVSREGSKSVVRTYTVVPGPQPLTIELNR